MKRVTILLVAIVATFGLGLALLIGSANLAEAQRELRGAEKTLEKTLHNAADSVGELEASEVRYRADQDGTDSSKSAQSASAPELSAASAFRAVDAEELASARSALEAAGREVQERTAEFQQTITTRNATREEFLATQLKREHLLVEQRRLLEEIETAADSACERAELQRREIAISTELPQDSLSDEQGSKNAQEVVQVNTDVAEVEGAEEKLQEATPEEQQVEVNSELGLLLEKYENFARELDEAAERFLTLRTELAELLLKVNDTDAALQQALIEQRRALTKLQQLKEMELLYKREQPSISAPVDDAA